MKKMLFLLALSASTSVLAGSAAEEMCRAALMATGKSESFAYGYCRGTSYSAARWSCALKYTSSGETEDYALGACSGK